MDGCPASSTTQSARRPTAIAPAGWPMACAPCCAASRHRRGPTWGSAPPASTARRFLRRRCWYSSQRNSSAGLTVDWLSEPTQRCPLALRKRAVSKNPSPRLAWVGEGDAAGAGRARHAPEFLGGGVGGMHEAPMPIEQSRIEEQLDGT